MTLHNRFMDDIIFVPSNSSTSSSSKKKKKPRNFSGTDLSAKSRHVRSLFRSHLVPVCTRDFTGRVSLIQITTACCYETEGRSVVQKKKKRQMRTFLKFRENSVRNLCPSWNSNRSETPFIYERNFNIWFIWTLSFISRNLKLQNEQ